MGANRTGKRSLNAIVELLVVIAIVSILISVMMPSVQGARNRAVVMSCSSRMRSVYIAAAAYMADHPTYPEPFWRFFNATGDDQDLASTYWLWGRAYIP
jgi:type II secretory pathway pseudopilin PulG